MANEKRKPVIAVDFDGVVHSYTSGWKGAHVIPDAPVPGAIEFLTRLCCDDSPVTAVIFSARARTWRGRRAMKAWLRNHAQRGLWDDSPGCQGIRHIPITATKPPAKVYLDDRAYRFEGTFPADRSEVLDLVSQKPWNKR